MDNELIYNAYNEQRKNILNCQLRNPNYRIQKLRDLYQNILKFLLQECFCIYCKTL